MGITDWTKNLAASLSNPKVRPPFEGLYVYILAASIGYAVADISILNVRPSMLPQQAPPAKPQTRMQTPTASIASYKPIESRNIFSNDGKIPPALSADKEPDQTFDDGPATLSSLPLKLLGTIVHLNPSKSIATVNLSSKNKTESFRSNENIESMATVLRVERRKLIFRNLANGKKEYIEIPKDGKITFGVKSAKKSAPKAVQPEGQNKFKIKRSDLDKYTADLSSILSQARMVPNVVPGSGGRIDGFRFVSIKPDSIYTELGFKAGDIINGVDGNPVTSPTQAMEMYQTLKSSDRITLDLTRDNKKQVFDYSIE